MPSERLLEIAEARRLRNGAERAAAANSVEIERARAALGAARRQDDDAAVRRLGTELARLGEARDRLRAEMAAREVDVNALRGELDREDDQIRTLEASRPITLLPVRLETRFLPATGTPEELCVRIYPDDIHVDTHEPELTEAELRSGVEYWKTAWRAGGDPARVDLAWQRLVERFGVERARWIGESLLPMNPADRPDRPLGAAEPLDPEPRFGEVPLRVAAWTRVPRAVALPDQFAAIGFRAGRRVFTVWGNPLPDRLVIGFEPDPEADDEVDSIAAPAAEQTELPLDDEMRWMFDLDDAVRDGMAIRIPLEPEFVDGVDRLVVVGVRASEDADATAAELVRLFAAHRATDGFEVLPVGSPTNNTTARRTTLNAAAGDDRVLAGEGWAPAPGGAVDRLQRALGLDASIIGHIDGEAEADPSAAIHTVLWPATLGYYLEQLLLPLVSDATVDEVRRLFIDFVRGLGPLPTLRVGGQPYGVIPVIAPARFDPGLGAFDRRLLDRLSEFRSFWSDAVRRVPRVGRTGDIDRDLLEVLAMSATTQSLRVRRVLGRQVLETLWNHDGRVTPITEQQFEVQRLVAQTLVSGITLVDTNPRATHVACVPTAFAFRGPLVAEVLSETEPLAENYLAEALDALRRPNGDQALRARPDGQPLLALLACHAALLQLGDARSRIDRAQANLATRVTMEAELIDIERARGTWTVTRGLDQPIIGLADNDRASSFLIAAANTLDIERDPAVQPAIDRVGGLQISGNQLDRFRPFATDVEHFVEFREQLEALAKVPTASLDRALRETLDVLSHRLDAWYTAVAARALARLRETAPAGTHLGAYGFVEDLHPRAGDSLVPAPPNEGDEPVRVDAANAGYVHTPSLSHAVTAAVLRSGFLAHGGAAREELSIDLSAPRVRRALSLIDGVRAGQGLNALIGYRFERLLKERGLAEFTLDFRRRAPLTVDLLESGAALEPSEEEVAIAANVVDGERLLEQLPDRNAVNRFFGQVRPDFSAPRIASLVDATVEVLADLDDGLDAVGDVLLAESVHQVVEGNPTRAAAALEALQRGGFPPEPEVSRTPRTGVGLTHRMLVLLEGAVRETTGWPSPNARPRARAEPRAERWAASLLGDPANVHVRVRFQDPDDGPPVEETVTLAELGVAALDVVYGIRNRDASGLTEMEARVVRVARERNPGLTPGHAPTVGDDPSDASRPDAPSFSEWLALAEAIHRVLGTARELRPADLVLPEEEQPFDVDADELERRADDAVAGLEAAHAQLAAALTANDAVSARSAVERLGDFGISAAFRIGLPFDTIDEAVAERARAILDSVDGTLAKIRDASADADDTGADRIERATARLQLVFGPDFRGLPVFVASNGPELSATFSASTKLQGANRFAAAEWLIQMAATRPALRSLHDVLGASEVLVDGPGATGLRVGQLPHTPGDTWIGLPFPDDDAPAGNVGLVVHAIDMPNPTAPIGGLLIDEWHEVVPRGAETTGVAFHYDQPGTTAPNAVVVGVHPGDGSTWDLDRLVDTVVETIELSRIRGADLETLRWVGRFLPAIYLTDNRRKETPSIDLSTHIVERQ